MRDPFGILLGDKAKNGEILFNKVSFAMPEFIVLDESIYVARALALKCGFAMFCSNYLKCVTTFKNENSFIKIYDAINFHEFEEAYFYLFGKYKLGWQELEIYNEADRKEARFEIMIEKLLIYYSEYWKYFLVQKFESINSSIVSDIVFDELTELVKKPNSEEAEKSYHFFSNLRSDDNNEFSIDI
jgi:hypothetical protein